MNKFLKALTLSAKRNLYLNLYSFQNPFESVKRSEINDLLVEIRLKGFAKIEGYYSEEQCARMVEETDRLLRAYEEQLWADEMRSDLRVFGANYVSELVGEYCKDLFIHEIRNAYFQANIDNNYTFTLANKVGFKEANLGSGGGWHRDLIYGKIFKSILYLTDVDESNGPFQYIQHTHTERSKLLLVRDKKLGPLQNRISNEDLVGIENERYPCKTLTGKMGTLILVDTSGIHRGKPIEIGTRYALTNYYSLESAPPHITKHFPK